MGKKLKEVEKKFLEIKELVQLSEANLKAQVIQQKIQLLKATKEILSSRVEKNQAALASSEQELSEFIQEHKKFKDELCDKYNLSKDGFQFDVETGEVMDPTPISKETK